MKKVIFTAGALLVFAFSQAQDSGMRFGAILGSNLSKLTKVEDTKNLFGFHIGGLMEKKFNDKWAVQPELMYSTQGFDSDSGKFELGYINVPIMAKYYVAEQFNIMAGPQVGFMTSAKADGTDVKSLMNTTDFGLNFGAGYDIDENFMVQLRYNMGLTDVAKDDSDHAKNSVFQLSLGYKF